MLRVSLVFHTIVPLIDLTEKRWLDCLAKKDWSDINNQSDVNEMVNIFYVQILDDCYNVTLVYKGLLSILQMLQS